MKIVHFVLISAFALFICSNSTFSQTTEIMSDIPDGSASVKDRTILVIVKDPAITNVVITDKGDGENSFSEEITPSRKSVSLKIPAGQSYVISTFSSGNRNALEKKVISVSMEGQISFGAQKKPSEQKGGGDGSGAGKATPNPGSEKTKLSLQAAAEIAKGPSVPVRVRRANFKSNDGLYVVEVKNGGRSDRSEVPMAKDKSTNTINEVQDIPVTVFKGENVISVFPKVDGKDLVDQGDKVAVKCVDCPDATAVAEIPEFKLNEHLQVYFGTEVVGASAAASDAQPFFNVKLNIPIKNVSKCRDERLDLNRGCFKFWADFRFASTPTQSLPNFTSLAASTASNFFGSNQSGNINELVKSFQTKIGVELGAGKNFSIITGAGITSPLGSRQSVQAYEIPRLNGEVIPAFKDIFGYIDYTGINTLLLTTGERDRFMRNWFLGGRLKYKFDDDAYPAEFDLTVGQDEAITRKLIGGILKFDATIPIKLGDRQFLYFGAGFGLKLTRKVNVVTVPFFLKPVADPNLYSNTNLIRNLDETPFGTSNRDNYSIRIGVDVLRLLFGNKNEPVEPEKPVAPVTGGVKPPN